MFVMLKNNCNRDKKLHTTIWSDIWLTKTLHKWHHLNDHVSVSRMGLVFLTIQLLILSILQLPYSSKGEILPTPFTLLQKRLISAEKAWGRLLHDSDTKIWVDSFLISLRDRANVSLFKVDSNIYNESDFLEWVEVESAT